MTIVPTIDPRFYELMPTDVLWQRFIGEDLWGNDTFDEGTPMRVRVEPVTVTMSVGSTQAGAVMAELGQSTRIICDLTNPRVAPFDHILIVNENNMLVVNSAMTQYNEHGPYYQELNCNNSEAPE